jgi:hypothetical protein
MAELYDLAIAKATPVGFSQQRKQINRANGVQYEGNTTQDGTKAYGFGTVTLPGEYKYTGSIVNNEYEGLGKIEYLGNSPFKEYYGFVKNGSPHGFGLGVSRNTKHEYHVEWLDLNQTLNSGKTRFFDEDADNSNAELLKIIKTRIKDDALAFARGKPVITTPGSAQNSTQNSVHGSTQNSAHGSVDDSAQNSALGCTPGCIPGSTPGCTQACKPSDDKKWGFKDYSLATAAAGLGAAGLYYAYNNYSESAKKSKRRKKRRDKKRSHKKRSDKKRSDKKKSDKKRSDKKRSDKKRSDKKRSDKKRSQTDSE